MKRLVFASALTLFAAIGCQKNNTQLTDQLAKLEKRIELLEQRLKAAPVGKQEEPQKEAFDIPVGNSYTWGNPNAKITLVEFSDIQCPFCVKAHESLVEKIQVDPDLKDKVKIVYKHFPLSFHKNARGASKATLAAGEQGPDAFWKMTKYLYSKQRELSRELSEEQWFQEYKKWAQEAGLNAEKFATDLRANDKKYEEMIQADMDLGSNKVNVRGTPSFFVNGWKLGQRNVEAVKQLINDKNLN